MPIVVLWMASFFATCLYLLNGIVRVGRTAWAAATGRPMRTLFPDVSPAARRKLRIAGRIATSVFLVGVAFLLWLLSTLTFESF